MGGVEMTLGLNKLRIDSYYTCIYEWLDPVEGPY